MRPAEGGVVVPFGALHEPSKSRPRSGRGAPTKTKQIGGRRAMSEKRVRIDDLSRERLLCEGLTVKGRKCRQMALSCEPSASLMTPAATVSQP
jgi:hypothetical protein